MKLPGHNRKNKVARRRRVVQLRAKRYSNQAIAASFGVDITTVERDLQAIREQGLDELPKITAETWGAALMEQYRERVAELRERLDLVDPRDHISAIRIFLLLRNEDNQLTKLWQSLGSSSPQKVEDVALRSWRQGLAVGRCLLRILSLQVPTQGCSPRGRDRIDIP